MRNTLATLLFTRFRGEQVGTDEFGNRYFRDKRASATHAANNGREKRWVLFAGEPEATAIPPAWHAWLHHIVDATPDQSLVPRKPWEKEHKPNRTMTPEAYRPPGHTLKGGKRDRGTGDYEPWTPA